MAIILPLCTFTQLHNYVNCCHKTTEYELEEEFYVFI